MFSPTLPSRTIFFGAFNLTCGSINTKGSWTDIETSVTQDLAGIFFQIRDMSANADYLVDIALDISGADQVIVSNLISSMGVYDSHTGVYCVFIPIFVPVGSHIKTRVQSTTGSAVLATVFHGVTWFPGILTFQRCTTLGANTADSGGAGVDPGGVAETKGTPTEISSSLSYDVRTIILGLSNRNNQVMETDTKWNIDVFAGSDGSPNIILESLCGNASDSNDFIRPRWFGPFPCFIPAGSRLAVRASCSNTDATDRLIDVILYCFD